MEFTVCFSTASLGHVMPTFLGRNLNFAFDNQFLAKKVKLPKTRVITRLSKNLEGRNEVDETICMWLTPGGDN